MTSSYKADQVGSLLRSPGVLEARTARAEGRIEAEQLREVEDKAILDVLETQRQIGIDVFTDGEFRRSDFRSDLAEAVEGMANIQHPLRWFGPQSETMEIADSWMVNGKLVQKRRMTAHESSFLKEHAHGPYKVTIPSAGFMAYRTYRQGVTDQFYPTVATLIDDMAAIVKNEVNALVAEGVPYIQIDAPGYTTFMDQRQRQELQDRGVDPDVAFDEVLAADNASFAGARQEGVTLALHLCRGNYRSHWMGTGGYDAIAERLFNSLDVDRFLLEYDSDRAGGFEPLRFVPKGKSVVLGLVTTKHGGLESQDDLLRKIDEASKYMPMEDMALSPQCGFATDARGNALTWDEQLKKLELVVDTAQKVWG